MDVPIWGIYIPKLCKIFQFLRVPHPTSVPMGVEFGIEKLTEWLVLTVRQCQSNEASILLSHHQEQRELPGERDNNSNNNTHISIPP